MIATPCFRITGEHLTDRARDMVLSEQWDDALALFLDTLDGAGAGDAATEVLRGTKRLVGINDLTLEDDHESEGYRQALSDLMAGRIRMHGGWYRPYAAISHIPASILANPPIHIFNVVRRLTSPGTAGRNSALQVRREIAATFANHPDDVLTYISGLDLVREVTGSGLDTGAFIFWTKCAAQPFWVQGHQRGSTQEEAIREYVAVFGQLEDLCEDLQRDEPSPSTSAPGPAGTMSQELLERRREYDQQAAARLAVWVKDVDTLAPKVRAQAEEQGGWFTINVPDGRALQVPRAPFEHWAFRRTMGAHLAHPWTLLSPPDLKQDHDDQHHTDWMLGAGLLTSEPGKPVTWAEWRRKDELLYEAVEDFAHHLQQERLGFKAHVLCGLGAGVGKVIHPTPNQADIPPGSVIVIPSAGSDYYLAARNAAAVIAEQGGAMAHLATVGREEGFIMVRVPNARKLYPEGTRVLVDGVEGFVQIIS